MTTKEFQDGIVGALDASCDGTGDQFIAMYFSRSENYVSGAMSEGIDAGDALIAIRHIIRESGIDPVVLASMLMEGQAA